MFDQHQQYLGPSIFAVACVFVSILVVESHAQRPNRAGQAAAIELLVKQMDTNKNRHIDPSEMKGLAKKYSERAGLDLKRSNKIDKVVEAIRNRGKKPDKKQKSETQRKVPDFSVEVPEQVGVRDFSPSGEERMSLEMMKRRFSASVMAQVERTMSRNDKNKSGLLESDEIARSRWSNPTWQESDRDQDGKLSQLELAYRYEDREEAARKKLEARRSTGNRATSNRSTTNRGRIVSSRTRPRNYASARASRTDSETSNERTGFNSGSDSAYLRYAEGLMKSYDKDKDGRLSKTELEEMRRPPKNADADRDGFVDKLEMIASVKQRSGVGGNSSHTSASAEKLRRRASGAAFNQSDTVFGGKDLNGDRQLQMVEFSEDWSDDVVNEFEEKDSNGDGVITEAEWQAK